MLPLILLKKAIRLYQLDRQLVRPMFHVQDYWVSVGAEFNNENDVWVGQASFTANITNDTTSSFSPPQANFTGPASMSIGSSSIFYVDLAVMYPVIDLKIDVIAAINYTDVMSICDAKLVSVSDAYTCSFPDMKNITPTFSAEGNTRGNRRMTMYLGRPINKLAREYAISQIQANKGIISFVVQITLLDDPTLVGKDYWIGATVEFGTTVIWAGQLKITATAKSPSQAVSPGFSVSMKSGTSVTATRPGIIQLDMTVPESTSADYLLEVVGPFQNGDAVFHMCGVKVTYGENIACGTSNTIDPEYRISSNFSSYADIMRVDLGRITNVGNTGWNATNQTTKNLVRILVYLKVANASLVTVGTNYSVSFGMFLGNTNLTIGQISVPVSASISADNITALNTPARNLTFGGRGSDTIPVGRTGKVLLNIQTARNTIYSPFNIEFIMPNATNRTLAKICKIQLQSVGQNNPCVIKESIEKSVLLLSSFNDTNYDRAVINMDSLCNYETVNDVAEDAIVLAINFILLNDSQLYSTPQTAISGGIMFSQSNLWVVQLAVTANFSSSAYTLSATPYITTVANTYNLNSIPLGFPAKFYIRVKLAPNSTSPLALNISTSDDALSICDIRLVRVGDGYPCIDSSAKVKRIFGTDQILGVNKQASIDIGIVDNVGVDTLVQSSSFDSNTIELELVTKLTPDATKAPNNSNHTVNVLLKYGPNYGSSLNTTATVTATTNTTFASAYTLSSTSLTGNISVLSITGSEDPVADENFTYIVKSETKHVVLSLDTVVNSTSQLSVTVSTPLNLPNVMEILYIGLLDKGDNVLCVTQAHTTTTYQPRNVGGLYTDIGEIKLGYVCNTGTNTVDSSANRIRIESLVRLLDAATVAVGSNVSVTFTVNSNNQSILVQTLSLTVGDASNYATVYLSNATIKNGTYLNTTENTITVPIAGFRTLPLVFTVIPFTSSKVTFDAVMPYNTSAIMTIMDVKFVSSGKNLPNMALAQNSFQVTKSSAYNSSQITKYEAELGVISNGGQSYRYGFNQSSDDDTFTVEVTLQMADHPTATNTKPYIASFGIHVANVVLILDVTILVQRNGTENLIFNVSSLLNTTTSTSTNVEIETTIALSNSSRAEAQNAVLNIFLPPYVSFVDAFVQTEKKNILAISKNNGTLALQFGTIFFTDAFCVKIILEPNNTYRVPLGISGLNTVMSYQLVGDTNTIKDVSGSLDYVNFTIDTTPDAGIACNTGPLGLQSGQIKTCQLTSSDDSIVGHEVNQGRYGNAGWSPFVHAGQVSQERYFQVYFGNKTVVTKILLQQNITGAKLKTLKLKYSDDGLAWIYYNNNDINPNLFNSTQELLVPSPQVHRYIRLIIYDLVNNTEMGFFSFELIGCSISTDKPADVCSEVIVPAIKLPDFSRRSFLWTSAVLYVCDSVQGKKGVEQKCFSSIDDVTWMELDPRVGSILGYDSAETRVFAVSSNGLHYMSTLNGIDWFTSVPSDVNKAKVLPTFKSATKVSVDGNSALNVDIPDTQFIDSPYGATNDGIKKQSGTWKLIFSWNTAYCCP
ncbi:hypothetical protein BgiMline_011026 [Biomphalaria glabrata]